MMHRSTENPIGSKFITLCLFLSFVLMIIYLIVINNERASFEAPKTNERYESYFVGNTNYRVIFLRTSSGPIEALLAEALTEIKQKYEIKQVITINERTFLVEITGEKSQSSSPNL